MSPFDIVQAGAGDTGKPVTPKNVPNRGGEPNPSAAALRERFPAAVLRVDVVNGETMVLVETPAVLDLVRWLHDDAGQSYEYLSDVTAVEHRDLSLPIEVVWHLRSIKFRRFLRLKTHLQKGAKLEVPSVWPVYKGADWLERECYDMFGITFAGHYDLRRILMWEQYKEGFPLRKDFPLRGRFSRAEQLREALNANPEAKYSMEELDVASAFGELPLDMRERIASGGKTGE